MRKKLGNGAQEPDPPLRSMEDYNNDRTKSLIYKLRAQVFLVEGQIKTMEAADTNWIAEWLYHWDNANASAR